MKADEAKKVLKGTLSLMYQTRIMFDDVTAYRNAMKVAIEALEKQIPKKPNPRTGYPHDNRDTADGICPSCHDYIISTTPRMHISTGRYYCRNCGQKIDWSEVEE